MVQPSEDDFIRYKVLSGVPLTLLQVRLRRLCLYAYVCMFVCGVCVCMCGVGGCVCLFVCVGGVRVCACVVACTCDCVCASVCVHVCSVAGCDDSIFRARPGAVCAVEVPEPARDAATELRACATCACKLWRAEVLNGYLARTAVEYFVLCARKCSHPRAHCRSTSPLRLARMMVASRAMRPPCRGCALLLLR